MGRGEEKKMEGGRIERGVEKRKERGEGKYVRSLFIIIQNRAAMDGHVNILIKNTL